MKLRDGKVTRHIAPMATETTIPQDMDMATEATTNPQAMTMATEATTNPQATTTEATTNPQAIAMATETTNANQPMVMQIGLPCRTFTK